MTQYGVETVFILIVSGAGFLLDLDDYSQSLAVACCVSFYFGWKILPLAPRRRSLPVGHGLAGAGFRQVWKTIQNINSHYKHSLRWFLLSVAFIEAGEYLAILWLQYENFFLILSDLPDTQWPLLQESTHSL